MSTLESVVFFFGCLTWGLLPIGWLIVRVFGYGKGFRGEYSINRLRQSILDFGFEGFLMLSIGSILKGILPITLMNHLRAGESFMLAAALVTSLGASISYCGRNRDGTLILTCLGSLLLTAPDVVRVCSALWLSLIIIFKKFGVSGLVTSLFLPFCFLFLGYGPPYIVYGTFFGLLLAVFYWKDLKILNLGNTKTFEANILLSNNCNYFRQ